MRKKSTTREVGGKRERKERRREKKKGEERERKEVKETTETGSARDREETRETAFNYLPTGVKDGSFAPASSTPVSQLPRHPSLSFSSVSSATPVCLSPCHPSPSLLHMKASLLLRSSYVPCFFLSLHRGKQIHHGGWARELSPFPLSPPLPASAHRPTSSRPRLCGALNVTN